ncbi:MAG: vitamin K epoxide reductase family protein [Thermoleophilia bacterium]|nr:vitamin K epoxide reductase family protein [Thermoleophilia bacterium]
MKLRISLTIIIFLAVLGIADSGYALHQHYAPPETSACDFNATVSCTAINQSEYSVLLGMPVAALGMAGYALIAGLAAAMIFRFRERTVAWLLLALAIPALVFSLWLTWIEIFVLKAVCPLCVTSLFVITSITVLAVLAVWSGRGEMTDS